MIMNMVGNRKNAFKKRFARPPPAPRGISFPCDDTGARSSTPVNKEILASAVGEGKLPFAISAPLRRKQKILLSLTQKVCWEDLAHEELGFLFKDLVRINFSHKKEKLRRREKNKRQQWRKRQHKKSPRRALLRPCQRRLKASQRCPPPGRVPGRRLAMGVPAGVARQRVGDVSSHCWRLLCEENLLGF